MFTDEEKQLLKKYVTSVDEDIFAVRGMEGMAGAAYARYSRAQGGFREVLLKEFIKEGNIDPKHADELIQRILVAYGDDSVGELEGCHISFENISMLATKEIEDRRIGGSPIEQSTRYVFYDMKTEKGWRYLHDESLVNAAFGKQYVETMDFIFETYASLVEPMKEYFRKLKPLESAEYDINGDGVKEKFADLKDEKEIKAFKTTYGFDLRSKACDTLRALLPLSTLTNVGMFGNGRFYQTLISHLLNSDIPEVQKIAEKTLKAASEIIPQYVRRAKRSEYAVANKQAMCQLARQFNGSTAVEPLDRQPKADLLERIDDDVSIVAAMLYPYCSQPLRKLRQLAANKLTEEQKTKIIKTYIGERKTRRDRPGRALEDGYLYTFDMVTNWGVYKDLMRHRMNTQQRQLFTPKIAFEMPQELIDAGFEKKAMQCVNKAQELYDAMLLNPSLAQYAVLHGHLVRWTIGMNDREAMHMIELRTTPQGHPQYRKACQMMHQAIAEKYPWRAEMMSFADYNDYYWSRADSEAKQRVKEAQLDEKYKKD